MEQYHGIHAAGNGDEDFPAVRNQVVVPDFVFDALKEFGHPAILLFFVITGKQLNDRQSPRFRT
jgi:hypothetical protein